MKGEVWLANAALSVGLSSRGGVLTGGQTADGRAFLRGAIGPEPTQSACFPLVPLGNRVAGNRFAFGDAEYALTPNSDDPLYLHGDGWLSEWSLEDLAPASARLGLRHDSGPFRYQAEQTIRLDGNQLHLVLSVTNTGPEAMPFGLGFHPYFPRGGALVQFDADAWWTEAPGHLPGQRLSVPENVRFSTARKIPAVHLNSACEGWSGVAVIEWPDIGIRVKLSADPIFDVLMIYAPKNDPGFFCLEPMTHLPNALNMQGQPGLHVLAPGDTLSGGITMTVFTKEPAL